MARVTLCQEFHPGDESALRTAKSRLKCETAKSRLKCDLGGFQNIVGSSHSNLASKLNPQNLKLGTAVKSRQEVEFNMNQTLDQIVKP